MKNPRITAKERGLLKGAIRRVFSRSDLRRAVVEAARVDHTDPKRPRVKKWAKCPICKEFTAAYQMQVDHKIPIIPLDNALEHMSWDVVIDRTWCEQNNLQAICQNCHSLKTKLESKERRKNKSKK